MNKNDIAYYICDVGIAMLVAWLRAFHELQVDNLAQWKKMICRSFMLFVVYSQTSRLSIEYLADVLDQ